MLLRSFALASLLTLPLLGANPDPAAVLRAKLAGMTAAEKSEILRARQRFERLGFEEQRRLRELDAALISSPRSDELRQVLDSYYEWFTELPPERRSELRLLDTGQRLDRVRELREQELREASRARIVADFRRTVSWVEEYAVEHERRVFAASSERVQQHLRRIPSRARQRILGMVLWQQWHQSEPSEQVAPLSTEDWKSLTEQLSPESRRRLNPEQEPLEQWRQLVGHLSREMTGTLPPELQENVGRMSLQDRWGVILRLAEERRADAPEVSGTELRRIFSNLSPEERERLIQLPPDELARQLRFRYSRQRGGQRGDEQGGPWGRGEPDSGSGPPRGGPAPGGFGPGGREGNRESESDRREDRRPRPVERERDS